MAVDHGLYRRLKDAGFTHQAALVLADPANETFSGGVIGGGSGGASVKAGDGHTEYVSLTGVGLAGINASLLFNSGLVTVNESAPGSIKIVNDGLYAFSLGGGFDLGANDIANIGAGNAADISYVWNAADGQLVPVGFTVPEGAVTGVTVNPNHSSPFDRIVLSLAAGKEATPAQHQNNIADSTFSAYVIITQLL